MNRLTNLPHFLTKLESLKVVYAHENPFLSPHLNIWQTRYATYAGGDARQQFATTELKALLADYQLSESSQFRFQESLSTDMLLSENNEAVAKYIGVGI